MTLAKRVAALEKARQPRGPKLFVVDNGSTIVWAKPGGAAIFALPHNGRDPLPGTGHA